MILIQQNEHLNELINPDKTTHFLLYIKITK